MNVIAICNELYNTTKLYNKSDMFYINNKEDLTFELLQQLKPQYVFFPHWSYRIPPEIYENFECVIFHETDLPFGRGGSPMQNLIERGIYETKITALKCNAELDAGNIYLKKDFSLKDKPAHELFVEIGNIVADMIDEIMEKQIKPIPQQGEVTVFKRRTPAQSDISSLTSLEKIFDYIRMLDAPGYPNAYLNHNNILYSFKNVKKENGKLIATVEIKDKNNE